MSLRGAAKKPALGQRERALALKPLKLSHKRQKKATIKMALHSSAMDIEKLKASGKEAAGYTMMSDAAQKKMTRIICTLGPACWCDPSANDVSPPEKKIP